MNLHCCCDNYIEDPCICDDVGEPKGQCANCGYKEHEHTRSLSPPGSAKGPMLRAWASANDTPMRELSLLPNPTQKAMNPDTTIQAFVDNLHPSLLRDAKRKATQALDDADALREEAELALKETQFLYPDLVPVASSVRVLVARAAESAAEELLRAIEARLDAPKALELSTHYSV